MANLPPTTLRYGEKDSEIREYSISKEDVLIGRSEECDINLDDKQTSRFHASLKITPDGFWLTDMDSTNGTLVDDKPIPPNRRVAIKSDQTFQVGSVVFSIQVEDTVESQKTLIQTKMPRFMYDVEALRASEFSHIKDLVILNNAATAPLPIRSQQKMQEVFEQRIATTRWHIGSYPLDIYFEYLTAAANLLNASVSEMAGVEGCSMGLNLFAQALGGKPDDNIVFCDVEYPANVYPWMSLQRDGVEVKVIPAVDGGLTLESLQEAVNDKTRLVAVSAVQFFTGHHTELGSIGKFCRERNILFVVDAIQAVGHIPIDVQEMNIDVLVTGGHKSLMAIPGVGFMYVREAVWKELQPRLMGSISVRDWSNYLNYNASPEESAQRFLIGTPNFTGQQAAVASMGLINELTREAIDTHTTKLAALALKTANENGYETVTNDHMHGSIATFKSKWSDDETGKYLLELEEEKGILMAKLVNREGDPHIRMSFHCYNTEEDVQRGFEALEKKPDPSSVS
ncbi:MAG TPA: aminotransferase class V-fold PLP-dependent enzyme [Anaerolineales bacterium]